MQILDKITDNQVTQEFINPSDTEASDGYSAVKTKLTQIWVEEYVGEHKRLIAKWILI